MPSGPCTLVLEGEAGIGKTTLWSAGVALSREAFLLRLHVPSRRSARLSYAALADLMENVIDDAAGDLPDLQRRALQVALLQADPSDGAADHRTVSAATLGTALALARAPRTLGVDDEQWLDASSAAAPGFALRRLREERVGLLATRRSGQSALDPTGLTRAMSERQLQRMRIAPLSIRAVGGLIGDRLGLRLSRRMLYRVHETSRGNPLFALELAR